MILITGGTGFVGKHLQEELVLRGVEHHVFSAKDCDLTIPDQARAVFADHRKASTIIHMASYQAAGEFPARHPAEQFYLNNLIHVNVLENWRKFTPHAKLVAIGSSCAYPSKPGPLTEDRFMDGEIHGSVYSYAFTKRLLYTGITAYNDQFELNGSYLIPSTMYGEYDDFNGETAHVCGALVGRFVTAVKENLPVVEIWGDGTQVRDFMYVKEFIRALLNLIPQCERDIINVGPGRGITISELALAIAQAAGYRGEVIFNASRYVGVKEKFIDTSRFVEKYHGVVGDSLYPGVQQTVDWYASNYERVKNRRKFQSDVSLSRTEIVANAET
jgi:GDP-L-fucose synthase